MVGNGAARNYRVSAHKPQLQSFAPSVICGLGSEARHIRGNTMDALIVIDMQQGLLAGPVKLDLADVIGRINQVAAWVRGQGGVVIWVQHESGPADGFAPGSPGWELLPGLEPLPGDIRVGKKLNDAFAGTELQAILTGAKTDRVLIAGWATDFCVDGTLRSAVSRGFHVVAISDGHTVADRDEIEAATIIRYHNWLWANLIPSRKVEVLSSAELIAATR
jgi:nicotinamidase-related amidase